ncbi:hypothetical protein GCM10011352_36820 [Marinobacterium zhoushanense]|uniref:Secreted protein n=1 Tax=Marinobacterium zhoushanense TaxID=1679163 RepID=A0ABQ1KSZ6_9GAMM|nr:hypothetical protein GCM10011352_36820 [Marinobacterium zhoushanense]
MVVAVEEEGRVSVRGVLVAVSVAFPAGLAARLRSSGCDCAPVLPEFCWGWPAAGEGVAGVRMPGDVWGAAGLTAVAAALLLEVETAVAEVLAPAALLTGAEGVAALGSTLPFCG